MIEDFLPAPSGPLIPSSGLLFPISSTRFMPSMTAYGQVVTEREDIGRAMDWIFRHILIVVEKMKSLRLPSPRRLKSQLPLTSLNGGEPRSRRPSNSIAGLPNSGVPAARRQELDQHTELLHKRLLTEPDNANAWGMLSQAYDALGHTDMSRRAHRVHRALANIE